MDEKPGRPSYIEDEVLTEYIWYNYSHLVTTAERFTAKTIPRGPESALRLIASFPESDCSEFLTTPILWLACVIEAAKYKG